MNKKAKHFNTFFFVIPCCNVSPLEFGIYNQLYLEENVKVG